MDHVSVIILHHSASGRDSTTMEDIRFWHTDPDKPGGPFDDIGYHYVIEGTGEIRPGRRLPATGAHAPPNNGRVGICITGDNTVPREEWNTQQLLSCRTLVHALRMVWPGLDVVGHRDIMPQGHTECPGVNVGRLFN